MPTPLFSHAAGRQQLADIDILLNRHQTLWRGQGQPQVDKYPQLLAALRQLSEDQVANLQADDLALLHYLSPYFPDAAAIIPLIAPYSAPPQHPFKEPPRGIPGNKWQQIVAFCEAPGRLSGSLVEWCSGKAYLGEALCQHPQHSPEAVVSLELDQQLVAAANQRRQGSIQHASQCDVLGEDARRHLLAADGAVALHACGGLHQRLLTLGASTGLEQIVLAPCCYHRFSERYTPLSKCAQASALQLNNRDLRLAVRQTCTARRGETLARRQLQRWWLATQVLAEQQAKVLTHYRPLPHSAAKKGFANFVHAQCAINGLAMLDLSGAAQAHNWAKAQQLQTEQEGLAAMLFRRLLELRCVYDSALFLCENGYVVRLMAFCSSYISPRNLLITARRQG